MPPSSCPIGSVIAERITRPVPVSEKCVDLLTQLLLDQPTAAGGSLEFSRKAQVPSAPKPEPANALDTNAGGTADVVNVGDAFHGLK
jgi:hypothetical protein